jgi:hypothetical protein
MHTRRRPRFALAMMLMAAWMSASPLMQRNQTIISIPAPGEEVTLYTLAYKPRSFEAKVYSVKLKLTSEDGADPVTGEWTFMTSNSDGQLHKVEIFTRILDESGTQLTMESRKCMIGGGYHEFACTVPLNMKAADWKAAKSVRIVTDWQS